MLEVPNLVLDCPPVGAALVATHCGTGTKQGICESIGQEAGFYQSGYLVITGWVA